MATNESAENYLETILVLSKQMPVVRSVDIANEMGFKKSSVSIAMKRLRENGYIEMDADGYITLLPPGEEVAQRIYTRHRLLTDFLVSIGVSPETAEEDACKVEHDLSDETFSCIQAFAEGRS